MHVVGINSFEHVYSYFQTTLISIENCHQAFFYKILTIFNLIVKVLQKNALRRSVSIETSSV
jgi:hypothetical protein